MDSPLHPPLRIDALSRKALSTKSAQKCLESFLQDFQDRTTAAQSGQTAVTVQVQKLKTALKEERKAMEAA
ncbi:hypothetical protein B0H15DRAFT_879855 [Mycena belliarum]|uniref:Uncharacterized protein n=1 Tax=Mycena belliarum TaxID=1033014 RepID=A0AAD6UBU4_9AGAR|nr:hypothetical protein B0H15DRAFT_879855 [Mycena belliae]